MDARLVLAAAVLAAPFVAVTGPDQGPTREG
jgi:hypothetical protein